LSDKLARQTGFRGLFLRKETIHLMNGRRLEMSSYDEIIPLQQRYSFDKEHSMGLWRVIVMNKQGKKLLNTEVVAQDLADAKFEASVDSVVRKAELRLRDVTIIALFISAVKYEGD